MCSFIPRVDTRNVTFVPIREQPSSYGRVPTYTIGECLSSSSLGELIVALISPQPLQKYGPNLYAKEMKDFLFRRVPYSHFQDRWRCLLSQEPSSRKFPTEAFFDLHASCTSLESRLHGSTPTQDRFCKGSSASRGGVGITRVVAGRKEVSLRVRSIFFRMCSQTNA